MHVQSKENAVLNSGHHYGQGKFKSIFSPSAKNILMFFLNDNICSLTL